MATAIGDYLRKLRLANGEVLKDMAEKLGVSSAFLSAVEHGKKKVPANWDEKLRGIYHLSDVEMEHFNKAIMESRDTIELNIKDSHPQNRELAISFARQFDSIDEETSKEIMTILKKRRRPES